MGYYKIDDKEVTMEEFINELKGDTKICFYRHCDKNIASHKKFCCRNHKEYERTYVKRELKKIEQEKQNIIKMLRDYQTQPNDDLIKLFEQAYKK